MRGTLTAIDRGCLMTELTYFAQQSCAFTLEFRNREQAKCTNKATFKALGLSVKFMNSGATPLPSV